MELVCNMRQMMHDESGVEPNYFIVPQSKTAALIKSNPLYTRYKEGGQEAVDTLKSPLEPEIDFNGVKLMNAPDYKSIDNQFSQVSMKRRYTVGRYEPLTNDADCDPTKIPEVSIFDLYRGGDYKAFTLLDVFAHSGRFKKSLDDPELWVFDVETYRMTCPGLPIGNLEVFETDNPDPFMVKVEGGYSWHPHLFNENNNPQERTMDEWCQCFMTNDRNFQSLNTKRESMTDAKQNFDSTSNQLQVVIDQYNYYQSLFPLNGDIADQQINGVKNLAKIDVNFEIQNLEGLDALCLRYILHILNFEPFLQTPVYVDHERYLLIAFILYIQDIPTPQVDANILGNEVNWLNVIRRIFEAAPGGNRRTPIQEYINQLAGNNPDFADLLNQARVDDFNNVRDLLVALIALAIPDHPEINTTIRRMINVGKFFVVANEQYRMTTQYKQLKTLYEEAETTYNESKNKTNRSGLSALLFRPFDSGYVDMGLMVRGGPDLGFVAHSPEFFEAGSDPTNSSHTLDFRVWIGPFIKEMRFVKRADSVYYSGILYGSGTKIIDNDARRRLMNENFRLTNPDDPCLYVILFPTFNFDDNNLKKRRFEDPPKRLHIVGKRDVDTEESNLGDYPGWDFYSKYYGWQNFQTSFNHENCPIASYVCKGSYFYPTNSYGGIHKVPGETHHGPNEGSYSVRIRESGVGIIPV